MEELLLLESGLDDELRDEVYGLILEGGGGRGRDRGRDRLTGGGGEGVGGLERCESGCRLLGGSSLGNR